MKLLFASILLMLGAATAQTTCTACAAATCPADDGKIRVVDKNAYQVFCDKSHDIMPYKGVTTDSLAECMQTCADDTKCLAGSRDKKSRTCFLKNRGQTYADLLDNDNFETFFRIGHV